MGPRLAATAALGVLAVATASAPGVAAETSKSRFTPGANHGPTGCTAMGVAPGATADGSGYASQTDDGEGVADYRVIYVPAKSKEEVAKGNPERGIPAGMRPVYGNGASATRLVAPDRSKEYMARPETGTEDSKPYKALGFVKERAEGTYAYYDGDYGLQNDWISIGESTCSAKLYSWPLGSKDEKTGKNIGTSLFSVEELSRLCLERCKTAVCCIDTMGAHSEEHGFWSTQSVSDAGESLTISDGKETWVFHILADPSGKSAIWAAQRVPHNHMAVVANMFIIRAIDFDNKKNFKHSKLIKKHARDLGWWNPEKDTDFDFVKVFSSGEYGHPFYSARRAWRILSRVAPSLKLDGDLGYNIEKPTYPFSVEPDRKLTIQDMFALYRDHYEGTPYDLTQGVVSGPFGNPERWAGTEQPKSAAVLQALADGYGEASGGEPVTFVPEVKDVNGGSSSNPDTVKYGGWERSIAIYRTTYTHIAASYFNKTSGEHEQVLWFGPGRSMDTIFVPVRIKDATKSPESLLSGSCLKVDHKSLWWAVNAVANWADSRYNVIHQQEIAPFQKKVEDKLVWLANGNNWKDYSEDKLHAYMADVTVKYWDFFYGLMAKYQNGYIIYDNQPHEKGYPTNYLEQTKEYTHFKAPRSQFDLLAKRMKDFQKFADDVVGKRDEEGVSDTEKSVALRGSADKKSAGSLLIFS